MSLLAFGQPKLTAVGHCSKVCEAFEVFIILTKLIRQRFSQAGANLYSQQAESCSTNSGTIC